VLDIATFAALGVALGSTFFDWAFLEDLDAGVNGWQTGDYGGAGPYQLGDLIGSRFPVDAVVVLGLALLGGAYILRRTMEIRLPDIPLIVPGCGVLIAAIGVANYFYIDGRQSDKGELTVAAGIFVQILAGIAVLLLSYMRKSQKPAVRPVLLPTPVESAVTGESNLVDLHPRGESNE